MLKYGRFEQPTWRFRDEPPTCQMCGKRLHPFRYYPTIWLTSGSSTIDSIIICYACVYSGYASHDVNPHLWANPLRELPPAVVITDVLKSPHLEVLDQQVAEWRHPQEITPSEAR